MRKFLMTAAVMSGMTVLAGTQTAKADHMSIRSYGGPAVRGPVVAAPVVTPGCNNNHHHGGYGGYNGFNSGYGGYNNFGQSGFGYGGYPGVYNVQPRVYGVPSYYGPSSGFSIGFGNGNGGVNFWNW